MSQTPKTDTQDWNNGVTIIIPTFRRPEGVKLAYQSLMSQSAGSRALEIIIVDNDGIPSAKDTMMPLIKAAKTETCYIHVPEPGVSSARNGAMAIARGRYIAFLDDDMEATENWLSALLATADTHEASVVFGPIDAVMPRPEDALNKHMQPFFSRHFDGGEGISGVAFGMGGCLIDLARCEMPSPPFNPDMNEVGGEDDWLFSLLTARGASMAWSPRALTFEHVPETRLTLEYFWNRNFAFGQGPTQIEADKGLRGFFGVVKWMAVGLIQTLVFGPLYKLKQIMGRPDFIIYHAKLAQGAGKFLWWDGFSPRMYGAALGPNGDAQGPENKAA